MFLITHHIREWLWRQSVQNVQNVPLFCTTKWWWWWNLSCNYYLISPSHEHHQHIFIWWLIITMMIIDGVFMLFCHLLWNKEGRDIDSPQPWRDSDSLCTTYTMTPPVGPPGLNWHPGRTTLQSNWEICPRCCSRSCWVFSPSSSSSTVMLPRISASGKTSVFPTPRGPFLSGPTTSWEETLLTQWTPGCAKSSKTRDISELSCSENLHSTSTTRTS